MSADRDQSLARVPEGPAPVFDRAASKDRDRSIQEVRNWISAPGHLPAPTRLVASGATVHSLDLLNIDLPGDMRTKLIRAQDHGMVLPHGFVRYDDTYRLRYPEKPSRHDWYMRLNCPGNRSDSAVVIALGTLAATILGGLILGGLVTLATDVSGWLPALWTLLASGFGCGVVVGVGTSIYQWRQVRYGLSDTDTYRVGQAVSEHIRSPSSSERSQEVAVVTVAGRLIERLRANAAWTSEWLDLSRATFDPAEELREITEFSGQIRAMRTQLGDRPTGDSPQALRARQHWDNNAADLDAVFTTLVERVAALHHYLTVLDDLAEKIAALQSIEQSLHISTDIAALADQLGANDLAADRYDRLIADATALRADITALTTRITALPDGQ